MVDPQTIVALSGAEATGGRVRPVTRVIVYARRQGLAVFHVKRHPYASRQGNAPRSLAMTSSTSARDDGQCMDMRGGSARRHEVMVRTRSAPRTSVFHVKRRARDESCV